MSMLISQPYGTLLAQLINTRVQFPKHLPYLPACSFISYFIKIYSLMSAYVWPFLNSDTFNNICRCGIHEQKVDLIVYVTPVQQRGYIEKCFTVSNFYTT